MIVLLHGDEEYIEKFIDKKFAEESVQINASKVEDFEEKIKELKSKQYQGSYIFVNENKNRIQSFYDLSCLADKEIEVLGETTYRYLKTRENEEINKIYYY